MAVSTQADQRRFKEALNELISLLRDNEIIDVVPERLYVSKAKNWYARFDMSGYSIGKPALNTLLREFVLAATGLVIFANDLKNQESQVCHRLIELIHAAANRLRTKTA